MQEVGRCVPGSTVDEVGLHPEETHLGQDDLLHSLGREYQTVQQNIIVTP